MTVTSSVSRVDYVGDNVLLTFPYPFKILVAADLDVYVGGALQVLNVNYTVTGVGLSSGGNVVFVTAPGASVPVSFIRMIDITQETDYVELDKFPAETHEAALDKGTMIDQQLTEITERAPKFATSSAFRNVVFPDLVASKFIQVNAAGTALQLVSGTTPAAPGSTFLDGTEFQGMWYDSSTYASINAAVTAIGAAAATLVVSTAETLTGSITFPATLTLIIQDGGSIIKAGAYTVTINGPFSGTPGCFSGFASGNVTFGYGAVDETRPDWWTLNAIPGTTDMTTAIGCASEASRGVVRFTGQYAISTTITLHTGITYLGPAGGTIEVGVETPNATHGAALIWIGAASDTMVDMYNCFRTFWDGIDLFGTDHDDGLVGIRMYSNNTPSGTKNVIKNTNFMHLDYAIRIGAAPGVTDTMQSDQWIIENIWTHHCNIGIHLNSWNSNQMSHIRNSTIHHYHRGIFVEVGGPVKISSIGFGNLDSQATDAHIVLGQYLLAIIEQCQGEPWPTIAVTPLIRFTVNGGLMPIILQNNWVDTGIVIEAGVLSHQIISIGNKYDMDFDLLAGSSGNIITSLGDMFETGITIHDIGTNNQITMRNPYYTGGTLFTEIETTTYNQIKTSGRTTYGIEFRKPYTSLASGDATPDIATGDSFLVPNITATTLTNLDGGIEGQIVWLLFTTDLTTVNFSGTYMRGNSGVDWVAPWGALMQCKKIDIHWYCQSDSFDYATISAARDFRAIGAGRGLIMTNAAGTVTKRVRLNDAGNGLTYEDTSVTPAPPPPGASANLITAWVNSVNPYDTFAATGADITSAIVTDAATHSASTGLFWIDNATSYTLTVTVTLNSGQAPTLDYFDGGVTSHSHSLTAGVHVIVFTSEGTQCNIAVTSTAASNWSATFVMVETP